MRAADALRELADQLERVPPSVVERLNERMSAIPDDPYDADWQRILHMLLAYDGQTRERPKVSLDGTAGNAYAVIGAVTEAMREAGQREEEIEEFVAEAISGDYDHVMRTARAYAEIQ